MAVLRLIFKAQGRNRLTKFVKNFIFAIALLFVHIKCLEIEIHMFLDPLATAI